MILIHPPVSKPCEPPPGVARLAGTLKRSGVACGVIDANVEGLLALLKAPVNPSDTWTLRASRHLASHLDLLTHSRGYESMARYKRAVMDLNRVLERSVRPMGIHLSLANFQHPTLSPLRSRDLLRAAEAPETNPFYPYFSRRFWDLLEQENPSVVGFSLNFMSQAVCTFAMIGFLKRHCPGLRIVLGGGLVTSWMRRPGWRNPFQGLVDEMFDGPGEAPLLSILGLEHCEEHETPDYGPFTKLPYFAAGPILPYSASSGCYWQKCSFCPERAEGNPYRPVSVRRFTEDLHALVRETEPAIIHFLDNALSPAHLKALASDPPGVPWYGFTRVSPHLEDQDFCDALRKAGCVMLKLGLESGDQTVLDEMEKGLNLEAASTVLRNLKRAGIATYVYLLFGTPAENAVRARRTLDFTVRHAGEIAFLNLAIFNMPAFGPDAGMLDTQPFYEGDLSLYRSFAHPEGWERSHVRQFLDREFRRHPAVAEILRREPPVFTSNHAPFFLKPWDKREAQ
jgi:hypothetical protein